MPQSSCNFCFAPSISNDLLSPKEKSSLPTLVGIDSNNLSKACFAALSFAASFFSEEPEAINLPSTYTVATFFSPLFQYLGAVWIARLRLVFGVLLLFFFFFQTAYVDFQRQNLLFINSACIIHALCMHCSRIQKY